MGVGILNCILIVLYCNIARPTAHRVDRFNAIDAAILVRLPISVKRCATDGLVWRQCRALNSFHLLPPPPPVKYVDGDIK